MTGHDTSVAGGSGPRCRALPRVTYGRLRCGYAEWDGHNVGAGMPSEWCGTLSAG